MRICYCQIADGLVTSAGSLLMADSGTLLRSTDRGQTWVEDPLNGIGTPLFQTRLPAYSDSLGNGRVLSGAGGLVFSDRDGARNTWTLVQSTLGEPVVFADVPPSPALPDGRLLVGVYNGVARSDDGGRSWLPTSVHGPGRWRARSITFLPIAGHPYGGAVFAGLSDTSRYPGPEQAVVFRSDDGGATWTLVHRFREVDLGLPVAEPGMEAPLVFAAPDGALWAGVHHIDGGPPPYAGRLLRSTDGGATWQGADASLGTIPGTSYGYRVRHLASSRAGVLYALTDEGVWRTTAPLVAAEAWPTPASSGLALSVSPNPSRGAATVTLTAGEPVRARVVVVDVTGREVDAVEVWATPAGSAVVLDARGWAAGVYAARASVGQHTEAVTVRFTVTR